MPGSTIASTGPNISAAGTINKPSHARAISKTICKNIHPNTFSKSQLPALVKMCQRTLPSDAEAVCPLCSQRLLTVQIQRHLARHLEELSLFALPRAEEGP